MFNNKSIIENRKGGHFAHMKIDSRIFIVSLLALTSCKSSPMDIADAWTRDIKEKIVNEASQQADKNVFDSTRNTLTFYQGDKKLRKYWMRPVMNDSGEIISFDTVSSIHYSSNQEYELRTELCPALDRSWETVYYKKLGNVGRIESRYCNGKIKETRYCFGWILVGTSTKYDSLGNIIEQKDCGRVEKLNDLKDLHY